MNILDQIMEFKKAEVKKERSEIPISELEKSYYFRRKTLSLKKSLGKENTTGIIAEFKRQSPSKGVFNEHADVVQVTRAYVENGAAGLSILTDTNFFGGSNHDLIDARIHEIPLLRKDFIFDEYQIVRAKSIGADVVLLIAACLTPREVKRLAAFARNLDLEVLLELHEEQELEHICDDAELIGINNRDLKNFEVNINQSLRMASKIPANKIKIAESGINSVDDILLFKENGFSGFLIGELFMKQQDPGKAFERLQTSLTVALKH
jgi:indole-3-glycerol phosphate synthase